MRVMRVVGVRVLFGAFVLVWLLLCFGEVMWFLLGRSGWAGIEMLAVKRIETVGYIVPYVIGCVEYRLSYIVH